MQYMKHLQIAGREDRAGMLCPHARFFISFSKFEVQIRFEYLEWLHNNRRLKLVDLMIFQNSWDKTVFSLPTK